MFGNPRNIIQFFLNLAFKEGAVNIWAGILPGMGLVFPVFEGI